MVRIKKGSLKATVPFITYKNHYEKMGWTIVKNLSKGKETKPEEPTEANTNIEPELEPELEPERGFAVTESNLSSMSLEELQEFAARNNIDISKASTRKAARAIINEALNS